MTERLSFDKSNRIIQINLPLTEITIQEIYNSIREWECLPPNISTPHILDGSGKENLPSGDTTPITITLRDGWKIQAQPREQGLTVVTITGGNLRCIDDTYPIKKTAHTRVIIDQSTKDVEITKGLSWNWVGILAGISLTIVSLIIAITK